MFGGLLAGRHSGECVRSLLVSARHERNVVFLLVVLEWYEAELVIALSIELKFVDDMLRFNLRPLVELDV